LALSGKSGNQIYQKPQIEERPMELSRDRLEEGKLFWRASRSNEGVFGRNPENRRSEILRAGSLIIVALIISY
jgi:hypothetical protein